MRGRAGCGRRPGCRAGAGGRGRGRPGARQPPSAGPGRVLPCLYHRLRPDRGRGGALRRVRAAPPARPPGPRAGASARARRPPGHPPAAAPAGQADARLGLRSRGGLARPRAARAHRRQPRSWPVVQDGEGVGLPRHRGRPADRQLQLDARSSARGGGDERRHPRPHAGALRHPGRDPRLHHAHLEGRAGPRAMGARRPAARPGAARPNCATSSTRLRTRPGGVRARTWA
jgi:hypothetical protein